MPRNRGMPIGAPLPERSRDRINFGKLADSQVAFLQTVEWHLEAWHDDGERLRTVWPTIKKFGRWFSSEWPIIGWEFIKPSVDR